MLQPPPVNVRFEVPTEATPEWREEAKLWLQLNATPFPIKGNMAIGHPGYFPLTIKAAYMIGVVHDICSAVSRLLENHSSRQQLYISAYSVFASSVDILGRCIQGNYTHQSSIAGTSDILAGFKWLKNPSFPDFNNTSPQEAMITTSTKSYSISELVSLRHFSAHGQAAIRPVYQFIDIDYEILGQIPPLLANGLESYWNSLMPHAPENISRDLCNRLAKANILAFRNRPIYTSWFL